MAEACGRNVHQEDVDVEPGEQDHVHDHLKNGNGGVARVGSGPALCRRVHQQIRLALAVILAHEHIERVGDAREVVHVDEEQPGTESGPYAGHDAVVLDDDRLHTDLDHRHKDVKQRQQRLQQPHCLPRHGASQVQGVKAQVEELEGLEGVSDTSPPRDAELRVDAEVLDERERGVERRHALRDQVAQQREPQEDQDDRDDHVPVVVPLARLALLLPLRILGAVVLAYLVRAVVRAVDACNKDVYSVNKPLSMITIFAYFGEIRAVHALAAEERTALVAFGLVALVLDSLLRHHVDLSTHAIAAFVGADAHVIKGALEKVVRQLAVHAIPFCGDRREIGSSAYGTAWARRTNAVHSEIKCRLAEAFRLVGSARCRLQQHLSTVDNKPQHLGVVFARNLVVDDAGRVGNVVVGRYICTNQVLLLELAGRAGLAFGDDGSLQIVLVSKNLSVARRAGVHERRHAELSRRRTHSAVRVRRLVFEQCYIHLHGEAHHFHDGAVRFIGTLRYVNRVRRHGY
mmetsp:Transcript_37669/g.104000  ORF Transcript_37669/g.104000 Transcript_37669/m.104000 type:complete len:516 (+) Transcript_37669:1439-2986(+)